MKHTICTKSSSQYHIGGTGSPSFAEGLCPTPQGPKGGPFGKSDLSAPKAGVLACEPLINQNHDNVLQIQSRKANLRLSFNINMIRR